MISKQGATNHIFNLLWLTPTFLKESLILVKEQSNDCPNFHFVKTLLNPNIIFNKLSGSLDCRKGNEFYEVYPTNKFSLFDYTVNKHPKTDK